jgi:hypothetical protein
VTPHLYQDTIRDQKFTVAKDFAPASWPAEIVMPETTTMLQLVYTLTNMGVPIDLIDDAYKFGM